MPVQLKQEIGKTVVQKCEKLLGVIIDNKLSFEEHKNSEKAR